MIVGALFATVTSSSTSVPFAVPSFGVTSTETTSPLSACVARSSVSVSDAEPVVVLTVVPSTFQT